MKIKETGRIWLCSFDNDGSGDSVGTATDLEVAKAVCEKDAEINEIYLRAWRKSGEAWIAKTDDEFSYYMVFEECLFSGDDDEKNE